MADTRFEANESVSLAIPCDTQEEIDRLWDALVEGGEPGPCGWLKDRYGFSWQVYPAVLDKMMGDSDPEKVRRVTACFMADRQASVPASTSSKRPSRAAERRPRTALETGRGRWQLGSGSYHGEEPGCLPPPTRGVCGIG